jgi:hypothetical protein
VDGFDKLKANGVFAASFCANPSLPFQRISVIGAASHSLG